MPFNRKPLVGALVIGAFITISLGWLFAGIGRAVPFWGYPLIFAVFTVGLYAIGRLLTVSGGKSGPVRSSDISTEVE